MSYIIKFTEVGCNKRSWDATFGDLDEAAVLRSIRKNGGLMSRGIDIGANDETKTGTIFAGFRPIGKFTWEETL